MLEWSLFQDYEETIPSAEINDTPYESQADFYWNEIKKNKKIEKPNTKYQIQKIVIFQLRQDTIWRTIIRCRTWRQ